jgi:hypothetical protein
MKQIIISLAITASIFVLTFALVSAGEKKPQTRVFVSNKALEIKVYIEAWTKYGYHVESITAQLSSVASGAQHKVYYQPGDIILVMTK